MENNLKNNELFDESQSLKIINDMIQLSKKRLNDNGILFILWGWVMFFSYISNFIKSKMVLTFNISQVLKYSGNILGAAAIVFTLYYYFIRKRKTTSYMGTSLRYVWISLVVSLVLINLIQFNIMQKINFELQHPIFMVVIAFAITITGGILRYRLLIVGGIAFALLAYISSYLKLEDQLLLEAIAWLVAFIIPGHLMYANRK